MAQEVVIAGVANGENLLSEHPILSVASVGHTYTTANGGALEALRDVSFHVDAGEFVSVVGPSGCGKSSLLLMASGLLQPSSGRVAIDGREVVKPDPTKASLVFQDASLLPWRTAIDNVAFPAELLGMEKHERMRQARDLLELVHLSGFENSYPHELSGGMKQRVGIARGLMQRPELLLMDEPFGALDEQTRIQMGIELLRVWDESRNAVLFITHSVQEAVFLSDRVLVMTGRPGHIDREVQVDLPRPRDAQMLVSPKLNLLRQEVMAMLVTKS